MLESSEDIWILIQERRDITQMPFPELQKILTKFILAVNQIIIQMFITTSKEAIGGFNSS